MNYLVLEYIISDTALIWLCAAVLLLTAELGTPGMFFFLSCSVGAGFGALTAYLGYSMMLQWGAALVSTIVALYVLQQIAKKQNFSTVVYEKPLTNTDALLGKIGIVVQEITENRPGLVKIRGELWSAEHIHKMRVSVSTEVTIIRVDGNKVIVEIKE